MQQRLVQIKGYEGYYSVTDDGMVYSHGRNNNRNLKGMWLTKSVDKKGYENVIFTLNGSRKSFKVHRLVAGAFLDGIGEQINHIDGNKRNNHVSNLEWCTNRENTLHAYRIGLRKPKYSIKTLRSLSASGLSQGKVAKMLNIDQSTVSRVLAGKTGLYYGDFN